jgi:hypothetical protein
LTWSLVPGLVIAERVGAKAPTWLGRFTALGQGSLSDGSYLRAMFGAGSLLLIVLGMVLAALISVNAHFAAVPPNSTFFIAMLSVGLLDAGAGALAFVVFATLALVTGHVTSFPELLGLAIIGALWGALPVMVGHLRPFRRELPEDGHGWWMKIGDHLLTPFFGFFLTSKVLEALPGLTGLDLPIAAHHQEYGYVAAIVVLLRLFLEDIALWLYPKRSSESHIDPVSTSPRALVVGSILRAGFIFIVGQTLVGNVWQVYAMVPVYAIYAMNPLVTKHFPKSTFMHRLAPRSIPKVLFMMVAGQVLGLVLTQSFHLEAGSFLAWDLLLLLVVATVLKYLEGFKGEPWPAKNLWVRCAGVLFAVLTIAIGMAFIKIH